MFRPISLTSLVLAASVAASACGDDTPTTPTDPTTPVAITEEFPGTLNPNGGRTHEFSVERAGPVTARLTVLAPDDTVTIGLSIGTWNGSACQIVIAKDAATLTSGTVVGSATGTGQFCVRLYDVGALTASTEYTVAVEHY
jgi:hypothetical protein